MDAIKQARYNDPSQFQRSNGCAFVHPIQVSNKGCYKIDARSKETHIDLINIDIRGRM